MPARQTLADELYAAAMEQGPWGSDLYNTRADHLASPLPKKLVDFLNRCEKRYVLGAGAEKNHAESARSAVGSKLRLAARDHKLTEAFKAENVSPEPVEERPIVSVTFIPRKHDMARMEEMRQLAHGHGIRATRPHLMFIGQPNINALRAHGVHLNPPSLQTIQDRQR